jgi:23S rRNA C2498 (ribose-2'-O)-methylase RlmM
LIVQNFFTAEFGRDLIFSADNPMNRRYSESRRNLGTVDAGSAERRTCWHDETRSSSGRFEPWKLQALEPDGS